MTIHVPLIRICAVLFPALAHFQGPCYRSIGAEARLDPVCAYLSRITQANRDCLVFLRPCQAVRYRRLRACLALAERDVRQYLADLAGGERRGCVQAILRPSHLLP